MFIVRLSFEDKTDIKMFSSKKSAEDRFWAGWIKIEDYDEASASLYYLPGCDDARAARAALDSNDPKLQLLETLPIKIDVDLSLLGL